MQRIQKYFYLVVENGRTNFVTAVSNNFFGRPRWYVLFLSAAVFFLAACFRSSTKFGSNQKKRAVDLRSTAEILAEYHKAIDEVAWVPFKDLGPDYAGLRLKRSDLSSTDSLPPEAEEKLMRETRQFLQTLRAPSYNAFLAALQARLKGALNLSTFTRNSMREGLIAGHFITESQQLSDADLVELYWCINNYFGRSEYYYNAICPEKCNYLVFDIRDGKELRNDVTHGATPIPDRDTLGARTQPYALFGGEVDRNVLFSTHDHLITAIVRLQLRTNQQGHGYPLLIRYMWSESAAEWYPMDIAELWAAKIRYFPIF